MMKTAMGPFDGIGAEMTAQSVRVPRALYRRGTERVGTSERGGAA